MKKGYIWILAGIVAVCFIALLIIQSLFVSNMAHERNEIFDQIVNSCITRVVHDLETEEFIQSEFVQEQTPWLSNSPMLSISQEKLDLTISDKDGKTNVSGEYRKYVQSYPPVVSSKSLNNVAASQKALNERLTGRYQQKQSRARQIDRLLEIENKPLIDRVDFQTLHNKLQSEFVNNGINLPFDVTIVDHSGDTVFNEVHYLTTNKKANYKRHLFPNDINAKAHYVNVYFPTKKNYIYQSMQLATPAFIIATLLVLSVIFLIYILFKQKKLSEIKNDFINNMTHEFKTPISTISLASQMLKDTGVSKTPQSLGHISRVIHDETKRLGFQVEKVLQMAIFDRDKSRMKLKEYDIHDLIQSVISNFSIKVENRNGSLQFMPEASETEVMVDELHFTNVIFNLMDNALKYCHSEPHLEIKTWNEKQKVCISVKDNGIGIKKENLKRVFEKFYRVPTGNVHNVKGFGLGLAYVKKIVDDHCGSIKVDSEINNGTTFIICLPLKNHRDGRKI